MINTSLIPYRALLARQQLLHQHQHKRLASRIHDEICQQLTLLSLQLSLATATSKPPENWTQQCQQWSSMVLALGRSLRDIMNELQPQILDELGLAAALQWFADSYSDRIDCHLVLPETIEEVPPATANELFSVCRDVVNEIFASNGIKNMTIALEQTHDALRLHLRANQEKLELASLASKALDSLSVHERLFCVDGSVETQHDPVKGLVITLSVPLSRQPVPRAA
jgi:signal transduction histidine kinase